VATIQAFNYSVDVLRGLLWQHNRALGLRSLLESKQAFYDLNQAQFWEDWFRDVFDLRTANDFGCQVWARILGLRLALPPSDGDEPAFGFGVHNRNFDNAPFAPSGPDSVQLTIEQQRIALRLRYFQLITRCSVVDVNRFLRYVFADLGLVYLRDNLDMTITYVFNFVPDPRLLFVIRQYDLLPRPSAVGVNYVTTAREAFGFGEFNKNFDNAPFGNPNL
jgi:hypothetical protein